MDPRPDARLPARDPSANRPPALTLSADGLFVIFAPVLLLMAVTAALAGAAWWMGWYRDEMQSAARVAGAITFVLAIFVLYRQVRQREAATAALQAVSARVNDIVESAMDAIVTVDEAQRIVLFNGAAAAMFGYPRDEAIGVPLAALIPERFREAHPGHVRRFGEAGTSPRRMGGLRVVMGLRRSGEEFPVDASISQNGGPGGRFYTVILRDITERIRVEDALRRSKEELRELGAAAHAAREEEKTRIARELHDELAQSLTALQMDVAWCTQKVAADPQATAAKLAQMAGLLDGTVAATRRIAADLRPLMLDDLGLVPAVEWLAETFTQRNGIPCELAIEDDEIELPKVQATAVFRIVQEALANVAKHAGAARVRVAIGRAGGELTLSIRDDGVGFSPQDPRKPHSFGLMGLHERASLLGGTALVTSAPERGTQVEVRLPMTPPAARS